MPIYEYCCPKCNTKFEELRPLSKAGDKAICPKCQSQAERVPSCFSAHSSGDFGEALPIGGGSSCASCGAGSCASCGI